MEGEREGKEGVRERGGGGGREEGKGGSRESGEREREGWKERGKGKRE